MLIIVRRRTLIVASSFIGLLFLILLPVSMFHNRNIPTASIPNVVPEVRIRTPAVAFTFDDGPDPQSTPAIIGILAKHRAKATFFMIGTQAEKYPELVRKVYQEGHEIGNHGYRHSYSLYRNVLQAVADIECAQDLIYRITGCRPVVYRPPGGYISEELALALADKGLTVVTWSWVQDTKDWRSPPAEAQAEHILRHIKPGQILIFHDSARSCQQTVKAVDICLDKLASRGYRFLTVSQLIGLQGHEE